MNINPDWLNIAFLKKQTLLKDAVTLNEVKIDKGKLAEIDPKIACGHHIEGFKDFNLMQLAHTVSDAFDGQLRRLLIDTINMKCYWFDINEDKLQLLIDDVEQIYHKGYIDGVEEMRKETEAEK